MATIFNNLSILALTTFSLVALGQPSLSQTNLTTVSTSSTSSTPQYRIINGSEALPGAFPFMVALAASPNFNSLYTGQFCGGVLISSRFVITARHCVEGFESYPEGLYLGVGVTDLNNVDANKVHRADAISLHPAADIALVRLTNDVIGVTPVALINESESSKLLADGAPATILGWGRTSPDSSLFPVYPYFLHQAEVPVRSDIVCMQNLGRDFNPQTEMCAGKLASSSNANDGIDACYGDSGGPLLVKNSRGAWRLAGITSRGVGCASDLYYAMYASILDSLTWIQAFPPAAPRVISGPTLTGTAQVGQVVTCSAGVWSVDGAQPPFYFFTAFRDGSPESGFESSELVLSGVSGNKLLIGPSLEGAYLDCTEVISNPTATRYAQSDLLGVVTPAAEPVKVDSVAPSLRVRSRACTSRRRCAITVAVKDAGEIVSGVSAVTARGRFTFKQCTPAKGNGKVSCKTRVKNRQYGAAQSVKNPSLYTFNFGATVKGTYRLVIVAQDMAGNTSNELTVSVRSK